MESTVKEVVAYKIKQPTPEKITEIQGLVRSCLQSFDGFVSVESKIGASEPNLLMDMVNWKDIESAEKAQKEFEKHPQFQTLNSHIEEMKFFGHFLNQ